MTRTAPRKLNSRVWIIVVTVVFSAAGLLITTRAASQEFASENKLYADYVDATNLIREKHVDPPEYDALNRAGIQGMLRTLDPHSVYYDRKGFEELRREQRSVYYGIGASIQQRYKGVYIMEPFKDTPALRAGLRYGDYIATIDGQSAENWNVDQVRNLLRGELGTSVKLTVKRAGSETPIPVSIERGAVDLSSISTYYLVKPNVGYVNLSRGFHSTTSDELSQAIGDLKAKGAKSMILDLRNNPGGFLDQAIKVADKFLERSQTVLSVRGREGRVPSRDFQAESGTPETFPLVVLINRGSASASEIVAGAVQDHDRGMIVGQGSFGKGLVQTIFPLSGGTGLTLTTARYYTPSGRLIQRDYSNGSFYEYIWRRNAAGGQNPAPGPTTEQKRTDLGRTVYGGGGIEPDIKIEPAKITNAQWAIWTTGLFMFVRDLTAGKVAGAQNFKVSGISFGREAKADEFVVTDEIMNAYKAFMTDFIAKNSDIGLTKAMVDENLEWSRAKIREEAVLAAYGIDAAQKTVSQNDLQLQKAISEIPNAGELAERARKLTRSSQRN